MREHGTYLRTQLTIIEINVQVVSHVVKRLKTQDPRKSGHYKKIPKMLGFDRKYSTDHQKAKF